jgi:hypothetical protein
MSDSDGENGAPSSLDAMVKKMVRLALASEYSRLPIRRTDISTKVLGEQGTRQFKAVFEAAQKLLRSKFGMEMVELPAREKVTIGQRRGESFLLFICFQSTTSQQRQIPSSYILENQRLIHLLFLLDI